MLRKADFAEYRIKKNSIFVRGKVTGFPRQRPL